MTRVYLAVGHGQRDDGRHDPGAVGNGWNEQGAGDHIVAEAAKSLLGAGIEVYSEANRDDPNFPGTVRQANAWDADYVVSVHHDWIKAPEGAFGHWYSGAGKALADDIYSAIGDAGFPLRPSWHKRRDDLYLLKKTRAPAALIEVGRIGQDQLDTPKELRAMGRAIAVGIGRHLNIDLEEQEPAVDLNVLRKLIREEIDDALAFIPSNIESELDRLRRGVRASNDHAGIDLGDEGP